MSDFAIDDNSFVNPSGFKIERFKVTNMERLADAEMVGTLIAKKLKFFFTYDYISGEALDNILGMLWETDELFFTLKYPEKGVIKTATVYVGSIPSDLYRAGKTTNWVWKDVTFDLIQK